MEETLGDQLTLKPSTLHPTFAGGNFLFALEVPSSWVADSYVLEFPDGGSLADNYVLVLTYGGFLCINLSHWHGLLAAIGVLLHRINPHDHTLADSFVLELTYTIVVLSP